MKIIPAIVSLLGISFIFSCKQKPAFASAPNNNTLLWEISGNGLKHPSYFLGTMHMMCAEDATLSAATKKIIQHVHHIYLEVDMDNAGELLSGAIAIANQPSQHLEEVLTAPEYDRVKTFFENMQPSVPFSVLERQHPLMLSSSLYELFLTCEKKNGIELVIVQEAYERKKEIKGLETVAFQAAIFNQIPYDEQAKELVKTIDNLPKHKALLDEMISIYRKQDIEKLYNLTTTEEAGTAGYVDILLDNRNKNWVAQFDTIARANPTLFAVGAGHLGGPNGVINLLKQKGYSIRPLQN